MSSPPTTVPPQPHLTVVGGGLAGSEAAWQAAEQGVQVTLYEMRPERRSPAHATGFLAELVCSNSLGSDLPDRSGGLLKAELRRMGSLILQAAEATAVPAGGALAVDRDGFAEWVTGAIERHPRIQLVREEVTRVPDGPTVLATGPLTSEALATDLMRLTGRDYLYFYDALAPIVTHDSIDMTVAFRESRYGRGESSDGDYINCPMTREEYDAFVTELLAAERVVLREFEMAEGDAGGQANPNGLEDSNGPADTNGLADTHGPADTNGKEAEAADIFFEGCLPIEVIARRGPLALAYGPMRPVGLRDPRTGRRPHAAVQLRQDNAAGTLYNLVGFQTNVRWPEQARILRMIPGLANAQFVRLGQMHRNTFLNAPTLLHPSLEFRSRPGLFVAGQLTGIEGYTGNAASGLLAGVNAARFVRGEPPLVLPATTMLGALCKYVTETDPKFFQPMKSNFGILPPLDAPPRGKPDRNRAYADRALVDLDAFLAASTQTRPT